VIATKAPLYVYGVVRAGVLRSLDGDGVAGAAVEVIEHGDLAAIVSPLPSVDLRVKRSDLQRHLHVIEAAFAETTILPCPFGTVVGSQAELEEGLLGAGQGDMVAGIERLDGTVQINVKAFYDEDELLRRIVAADAEIARLRETTSGSGNAGYYERLRLGELVAARVAELRLRDAERLVGELADAALDVFVEEPERDGVFKASFLVQRGALKGFDDVLESVSRREQPLLRFEAFGPLPPSAFAGAYARA
jgi:Gas vesicle synthesis protein GvpL/GvpF